MQNLTEDRIVPVIRENNAAKLTPIFLSSRLFIDFRDDLSFEIKYSELLRDIHGQKVTARPPLGNNPFTEPKTFISPLVSFSPERYVSPALSGTVTFDYSNNNGRYIVGSGDMAFETAWSGGCTHSIHVYTDPPSIRSVALAFGVREISDIADASIYDTSSRIRTPHTGEIVVWQNTAGYYLATKIENVNDRGYGQSVDEIKFSYVISPNKSSSFQVNK